MRRVGIVPLAHEQQSLVGEQAERGERVEREEREDEEEQAQAVPAGQDGSEDNEHGRGGDGEVKGLTGTIRGRIRCLGTSPRTALSNQEATRETRRSG